jgi:hypothetical protein
MATSGPYGHGRQFSTSSLQNFTKILISSFMTFSNGPRLW